MVKKITNNDTAELDAAAFALLDVSATWCQPCKMLAPIIDQLSEDFAGKVEFFNADTEENPALSKKLKVMSIPCLFLFREGQVVDRMVGFHSAEELKDWIDAKRV